MSVPAGTLKMLDPERGRYDLGQPQVSLIRPNIATFASLSPRLATPRFYIAFASPFHRFCLAFVSRLPRFCSPKPPQHRHFCLTFATPRRHLAFTSPSLRFSFALPRFCIAFVSFFASRHVNIYYKSCRILAFLLCSAFRDTTRHHTPHDTTKMIQHTPKMAPRWPNNDPKMGYVYDIFLAFARRATRHRKVAQHPPNMPQDGPKMAPKWAKSTRSDAIPAALAPRAAQDRPKTAPRRPKTPQDAPRRS